MREISPTVDRATGTVRAKVAIEHPPAAMTLGAAVVGEGRFQTRKLVVVPWSALSAQTASRPCGPSIPGPRQCR